MSDARVDSLFHVTGREGLDAALASGKGVILLANHFGGARRDLALDVPRGLPAPLVWRAAPERLRVPEAAPGNGRPARPIEAVRLAQDADERGRLDDRPARGILNAGMVVKVACDVRWRSGKVTPARFLGQSETFASTWVNLAAQTGAAVIQVFCRLDDTGSITSSSSPPSPSPPTPPGGPGRPLGATGPGCGGGASPASSRAEQRLLLLGAPRRPPPELPGPERLRNRAPAERLAR